MEMKYAKSHEWVKFIDENTAQIGITAHAAEQLGDIVFVSLGSEGDSVTEEEAFGDIESVKAVSDLLSPIDGTITKINEEVLDNAELINKDAEGTWLIEVTDIGDTSNLLDKAAYDAFVEAE